jgi:hypothetical protein
VEPSGTETYAAMAERTEKLFVLPEILLPDTARVSIYGAVKVSPCSLKLANL